MEVLQNGEPPFKVVEWNGEHETDGEAPHQGVVDGTFSEHLCRTKGTPQDGSSEKGILAGTCELVDLPGITDIRDSGHLEVQDANANESGEECRDDLSPERCSRRNVHVVSELQVLGESDRVSGRHVTV